MQTKCVFLDRDGVINAERGTYTFKPDDFILLNGVQEALKLLKKHNFKVIVITNQSGISQGIYAREDMDLCHQKMLKETNGNIDDIFYCPWHPKISESLMRKPDSLMMERAMALYHTDSEASWMIGDKERDITPAKKLKLNTILISDRLQDSSADHVAKNLLEAVKNIVLKSE